MPKDKPTPPPEADDPEQSRRFIDMAREVKVDETPGATDRAMDKIIRDHPPQPAKERRPRDA